MIRRGFTIITEWARASDTSVSNPSLQSPAAASATPASAKIAPNNGMFGGLKGGFFGNKPKPTASSAAKASAVSPVVAPVVGGGGSIELALYFLCHPLSHHTISHDHPFAFKHASIPGNSFVASHQFGSARCT